MASADVCDVGQMTTEHGTVVDGKEIDTTTVAEDPNPTNNELQPKTDVSGEEKANDVKTISDKSADQTKTEVRPVSDTFSQKDLRTAVTTFNVTDVDTILDSGVDLNVVDNKNRGILHLMVSQYLDLNIFQQAAKKAKVLDILHLLLTKGLDVNIVDKHKQSPLHYVCACPNNPDLIKQLVASGVRINQQDDELQSSLHEAVSTGDVLNSDVLIEHGADINIRNSGGEAPLHLAAKGRHHKAVLQLLISRGAFLNACDLCLRTPLHVAAKSGRTESIEALLHAGAFVNLDDAAGQTALYKAAVGDITGHCVELLLRYRSGPCKVDVNLTDKVYEETPLHAAVRHNMVDNIKHLVRAKPLPNIQDIWGETALHKAVRFKDIFLWKNLLDLGGDVNIQNHLGWCPRVLAIRENNTAAFNMMRQYDVIN